MSSFDSGRTGSRDISSTAFYVDVATTRAPTWAFNYNVREDDPARRDGAGGVVRTQRERSTCFRNSSRDSGDTTPIAQSP